ncbi:hypothetical protein D9M71_356700 [compost metagenome]
MQPRLSVGCGTPNCGLRYFSCHSPRSASSSPIAACIASRALFPRDGSEECPLFPTISTRSIITPLCRRIGRRLVGSPITAARPSGRPAAARARAPAMELSSSQVARISRGWRSCCRGSPRAASMTSAKKPFMSQVPRPNQRPSRSSRRSGSLFHRASSQGTVSV